MSKRSKRRAKRLRQTCGVRFKLRPKRRMPLGSLERVLRNQFGRAGPKLGVEIGVFRGLNAAWQLNAFPKLLMWLVDPYMAITPEEMCSRLSRLEQADMDAAMHEAMELTSFAHQRRLFLRCTSMEAALWFADESLDFAYVDANHTLPYVLDDIRTWWLKVRSGGILAGHDYGAAANRSGRFNVNEAVDYFVHCHALELRVNAGYVWSVVKP